MSLTRRNGTFTALAVLCILGGCLMCAGCDFRDLPGASMITYGQDYKRVTTENATVKAELTAFQKTVNRQMRDTVDSRTSQIQAVGSVAVMMVLILSQRGLGMGLKWWKKHNGRKDKTC